MTSDGPSLPFASRHRSAPSRDLKACHDSLSRRRGAREARGSRRRVLHRPGPGQASGSSPILNATCPRSTAGSSTASANGNSTISAPTARSSTRPASPSARAALRRSCATVTGSSSVSYEIEVIVDDEEAAPERDSAWAGQRNGDVAMREPLSARSELRSNHEARLPNSASMLDAPSTPILPADFDPLAPGPGAVHRVLRRPDHAPALQSAFRPPEPVAIIPDDWDAALPSAAPRPQPARPPQAPRSLPDEAGAARRRTSLGHLLRRRLPRLRREATRHWWRRSCGAWGSSETTLRDPEKTLRANRRRRRGRPSAACARR